MVAQWIRLHLAGEIFHENTPGHSPDSNWALRLYPLAQQVDQPAGSVARIHGSHDRNNIRVWQAD